MALKLFTTAVTTGDTRGTGLGLPSCRVFAEAVDGTCALASSHKQDKTGAGGRSEFAFAIAGSALQVIKENNNTEEKEEEKKDHNNNDYDNEGDDDENTTNDDGTTTAVSITGFSANNAENNVQTAPAPAANGGGVEETAASLAASSPLKSRPAALRLPSLDSFMVAPASSSEGDNDDDRVTMTTTIHMVVIDDSSIIRRMLIRTIKTMASKYKGMCPIFEEFATAEAAQPRLEELKDEPNSLVTIDHNM